MHLSNVMPIFLVTDLKVSLTVLSVLQENSPHRPSWNVKNTVGNRDGLWTFKDCLVAPPILFPSLFVLSHGLCHVSTRGGVSMINWHWWAPGFLYLCC